MLRLKLMQAQAAVLNRNMDTQMRTMGQYERSVTTLVDAAVKPKVGAYVTNIRTRLDEIAPGVADGFASAFFDSYRVRA